MRFKCTPPNTTETKFKTATTATTAKTIYTTVVTTGDNTGIFDKIHATNK